MKLPGGFEVFLEEADNICVKTNHWLIDKIKSFGYSVEFTGIFHAQQRGVTHHVGKTVLICEYSGEISYRNRFTLAHELGHIIFATEHKKIANEIDVIRKKKEEDFSISQEEANNLDEIEKKCDEFAGRLLVSGKSVSEIWKKAEKVCGGDLWRYIPFFASYFCVSEPCATLVLKKHGVNKEYPKCFPIEISI